MRVVLKRLLFSEQFEPSSISSLSNVIVWERVVLIKSVVMAGTWTTYKVTALIFGGTFTNKCVVSSESKPDWSI